VEQVKKCIHASIFEGRVLLLLLLQQKRKNSNDFVKH
jgi:hypothetical protein